MVLIVVRSIQTSLSLITITTHSKKAALCHAYPIASIRVCELWNYLHTGVLLTFESRLLVVLHQNRNPVGLMLRICRYDRGALLSPTIVEFDGANNLIVAHYVLANEHAGHLPQQYVCCCTPSLIKHIGNGEACNLCAFGIVDDLSIYSR
jgi:hypothetical protein